MQDIKTFEDCGDEYVLYFSAYHVKIECNGKPLHEGSIFDLFVKGEYYTVSVGKAIKNERLDTETKELIGMKVSEYMTDNRIAQSRKERVWK